MTGNRKGGESTPFLHSLKVQGWDRLEAGARNSGMAGLQELGMSVASSKVP